MSKPFAVVYYDHESVYTVTAHKIKEGSFNECKYHVNSRDVDSYAVVRNFEGEEINARNVQQVYPESVEF